MAEARAAAWLLLAACATPRPAGPNTRPTQLGDATKLIGAWAHPGGAELWLPIDGALAGAGFFFVDPSRARGPGPEVATYELLALRPGPQGLRYTAVPSCSRWADFDQPSAANLHFERPDGGFPRALTYTHAVSGLEVVLHGVGDKQLTLAMTAAPVISATPPVALRWAWTAARWDAGAKLSPEAPAWPLPAPDARWAPAPDGRTWLAADREGDALRVMLVVSDGGGGGSVVCAARLPRET